MYNSLSDVICKNWYVYFVFDLAFLRNKIFDSYGYFFFPLGK